MNRVFSSSFVNAGLANETARFVCSFVEVDLVNETCRETHQHTLEALRRAPMLFVSPRATGSGEALRA